jgi:hypothetical protein
VIGTHEVLNDLIGSYRSYAKQVELTPLIQTAAWAESTRWILLLAFDHAQLASVAVKMPQGY